MRAVVTRVSSASVTIGGAVEGTIDRGFLILLGVGPSDTPAVYRPVPGQGISGGPRPIWSGYAGGLC